MATLLKVQQKNAHKLEGKGKKRAEVEEDDAMKVESAAASLAPKRRNKQRVLMLSSRGVTLRMRHLMKDLESLLPHVKKDAKLGSKSELFIINELADLNNCNNCLFFEARRHEDLYLWAVKTPNGPSIRLHVQNIHTMDELKMTGNCLKGSRGLLSFDAGFDKSEHWKLIKEMFTHIFGVPVGARRSKPFIDHILSFSIVDDKIWFRNYQIVEKDPLQPQGPPTTTLVEIGPRFVMTPMKILEGSFHGAVVYLNEGFIPPSAARRLGTKDKKMAYRKKNAAIKDKEARHAGWNKEDGEFSISKVFA